MEISEQERHNLHIALDEVLGPEEANVLMSHLPPVGWADVATKTDLVNLESNLTLRIGIVEQTMRAEFHESFGKFRDEIHRDRISAQRQLLFVFIVALVGIVISITTG